MQVATFSDGIAAFVLPFLIVWRCLIINNNIEQRAGVQLDEIINLSLAAKTNL